MPADMYLYGGQFILINVGVILIYFMANYIYLPVFYKIKVISIYEYLELRFDKFVRIIGSTLYTISILLYLPIVIYIPALAFSQGTVT